MRHITVKHKITAANAADFGACFVDIFFNGEDVPSSNPNYLAFEYDYGTSSAIAIYDPASGGDVVTVYTRGNRGSNDWATCAGDR